MIAEPENRVVAVVSDEPIPFVNKPVRIKKIGVATTPLYPTPKIEDYVMGGDNPGVSTPVEYTLEGTLLFPITVGNSVLVNRTKRNDVVCPGFFQSSTVVEFKDNVFTTRNSLYEVEYL